LSSQQQREPQRLASGKLVVDEPADGVARITLANPQKSGALDHEMLDALESTMRGLDTRCVLITGEGSVFSAGYDIGNFEDENAFSAAAETLIAHPFHGAIEAIEGYPYPVVCAINGHAIGGGLELALSCDIRIAASGAKLGMPPAKLGLVYSHTGLKKFLDVCGPANTSELFFVAKNVDAERAERMGLVNVVVDKPELATASITMASTIAARAPLSLQGNKHIIHTLRNASGGLSEQTERELIELRQSCFQSDDFREGVRAFGQKRAPQWKGC
jgi:enoyl-CoA hydratase/carnithine racemase